MTDSEPVFGKFQLKRKLGSGGFGEVWQAFDTQLKRDVALKVLHQGLMTDARFVDKAQGEARLVGQLDHPNIVKVLEVDQAAGRMYIAMHYIDGQPLSELIKAGRRFTVEQALNVVEQMASALDATHEKKIVHRDVKPANILIDSSGNAHLVDFGLAHAALSSLGASATAVGLGTAMYMSPEQAAGRTGDRTTDIYSLGVIAYELLAGRLPFQADTLMGYMLAHKDQAPPPPSKFNPSISRDVQDVLLKALSKDTTKRYKTAGSFAKALRKAAGRPFRKPGGAALAWLGCAAAGLVVMVLVVGGGSAAAHFGLIPVPAQLRPLFAIATATQAPTAIVAAVSPTGITAAAPSQTPAPILTNVPPTNASAVATSTQAPAATATQVATTKAAPSQTVAPSDTPVPTAAPSDTATTAPGTPGVLVGTGVKIEQTTGGAQSGKGRLVMRIGNGLGAAVENQYVQLFTQKQDLSGGWVVDQQVANGRTDNTGQVAFDVAPAHYIVRSDWSGYNWGSATDVDGQADVAVESGQTTQLTLSLARLKLGFLRGDNSVISGQYIRVFKEKQDIAGNWVRDQQVADGRTDNSGVVTLDLSTGYYIVASDFTGYNWGSATDVMGAANFALPPGSETPLILHLGRLRVGLVDSGGKALSNQYMQLFKQQSDVSGKPALGDQIADNRTDNTGVAPFDLTPGKYALKIGGQVTYDLMVQSGHVTSTDGVNQQIQ